MGKSTKTKTKTKKIILAILGAILILFLIDLTPLSGNSIVYIKWVQCGGKMPVREAPMITGDVLHYENTPSFDILRGFAEYFCTPYEAELAGYSADRKYYEFPHLTQSERAEVMRKKGFDFY